jgi:uroporphyrinogen-III synthase
VPTARTTSSADPAEARGVLITRPYQAARETARRVEALGWRPVIAPCLDIIDLGISDPPGADAVLVTSANALLSVFLTFQAAPLLAVGDATAARARSLGFRDVRSAGGDADALAALAIATLPPGARLLLPVGEGQGETLAARLAAAGFEVHRRVVYRSKPPGIFPPAAAEALHARCLRAATFLSAETARAFARLMPARLGRLLATVDALAIGETAAAALHPLPWRRVRVSASQTLDGILALL